MGRSAVLGAFVFVLVACGPGPKRRGTGETAPPGAWARVLVGPSYTRLVVTVDFVSGEEPSIAALGHLERRLTERCRKPDGVSVQLGKAVPPSPGGVLRRRT